MVILNLEAYNGWDVVGSIALFVHQDNPPMREVEQALKSIKGDNLNKALKVLKDYGFEEVKEEGVSFE